MLIMLIKQSLPSKSEGNTHYFPMLNMHCKERKGAGLSYTNQGPLFLYSFVLLFFLLQMFKQREKSLITEILKI